MSAPPRRTHPSRFHVLRLSVLISRLLASVPGSSTNYGRSSPPPVAPAKPNSAFTARLQKLGIPQRNDDATRLFHAHGQACEVRLGRHGPAGGGGVVGVTFALGVPDVGCRVQEVWQLRHGVAPRCPDVVVFPGCHEDVEHIMAAAVELDVCLIPFGGGTR